MALPMVNLPASWSNKNKVERLQSDAFASLSRMINRAVAGTNTNFNIWSALRTLSEQTALFKANYKYTGRKHKTSSNDRWFNGSVWSWRGGVRVASPDIGSNHQTGVAIDIHPGRIQDWIIKNGGRFGWDWAEGERNDERWHFRYYPENDQYKSEGVLDHGAVQKVVGAAVDHKIGTGTVGKIKAYQKANGLEADGIVGPNTKKHMGLDGSSPTAPPVEIPAPPVETPDKISGKPGTSDGFTYTYLREEWDVVGVASKVHPFEYDVKGIYLHYPAAGNVTLANESVEDTIKRLRGYSRDHRNKWFDFGYGAIVDQRGYTYEGRGLGMEPSSNGGSDSNNEASSILALLGDNEEPSEAMNKAINGLLAQYEDRHPKVEYIRGHKQSPDANTSCPGVHLMANLQNGTYNFDGAPLTIVGEDIDPNTNTHKGPNKLPVGKDLLMALIKAPDFPLLRTNSHLCYYGPADGPIESVSGKNENSLNPGEIVNGVSDGLKKWQTQMNKRGANLVADGKYGPKTGNAATKLQKDAGITSDSLIGPDTWYAAWLLPVK